MARDEDTESGDSAGGEYGTHLTAAIENGRSGVLPAPPSTGAAVTLADNEIDFDLPAGIKETGFRAAKRHPTLPLFAAAKAANAIAAGRHHRQPTLEAASRLLAALTKRTTDERPALPLVVVHGTNGDTQVFVAKSRDENPTFTRLMPADVETHQEVVEFILLVC